MKKVKIVADSTCDLSKELLHRYDISVLPLLITMEDESYKDGEDISPEEIYEWSNRTEETPKTAAPLLGDAIDFFKPFMDEDLEIIYFGISESMSTACNMIRLIAEDHDYTKLHVVDSKSLSTGIGLQVIRAGQMAMDGASVDEILEDNKKINGKVRASFVIDKLNFLARGGRCSSVTSLLANRLKIKPEIYVMDGKMDVGNKYRGNLNNVILKYAKSKEEDLKNAEEDCVFITHSGCSEEIIESVKEYLEDLNIFKNIYITRAGGVISSHCGPNTLGILYISK